MNYKTILIGIALGTSMQYAQSIEPDTVQNALFKFWNVATEEALNVKRNNPSNAHLLELEKQYLIKEGFLPNPTIQNNVQSYNFFNSTIGQKIFRG